jgi:transcriptional regulator with XRE-family HTH domain
MPGAKMVNYWPLLKKEIALIMKERHITQAQLSQMMNWKPAETSRYLNPRSTVEPGLEKLGEIAHALDMTLQDLLRVALEHSPNKNRSSVSARTRDMLIVLLIRELLEMNIDELKALASSIAKD